MAAPQITPAPPHSPLLDSDERLLPPLCEERPEPLCSSGGEEETARRVALDTDCSGLDLHTPPRVSEPWTRDVHASTAQ